MKKIRTAFLLLIITAKAFAQTDGIIVPTGHTGDIRMIITDLQFQYVYTVEDQKIIMWNIKTHQQVYSFRLPAKQTGVAISHDGKMLACSTSGSLTCYSTVTGKLIFQEKKSHWYYYNPVFSADDKFIYIDNKGEGLFKTEITTQKITGLWEDNSISHYAASFLFPTKDNSLITVTGKGWKVFSETDASKNKVHLFGSEGDCIAYYFPETNRIAIRDKNKNHYSDDPKIYDFYNAATGEKIKTLSLPPAAFDLAITDDGKSFVAASYDVTAKQITALLYSSETFSPVKKTVLSDPKWDTKFYSIKNNTAFAVSQSQSIFREKSSRALSFNTSTGTEIKAYQQNVSSIDLAGTVFRNNTIINKPTDFMNINTGASIVSVDLTKMSVSPAQTISTPGGDDDNFLVYSATGDTAAILYTNKVIIKNTKTNQQIGTTVTLSDEVLYEMKASAFIGKDNYFFGNGGSYFYFTSFSVKTQLISVWRLNVKTGVKEKMYDRSTAAKMVISPDKKMMAGIPTGDNMYNRVNDPGIKVWDMQTNKLLFQTGMTADEMRDNKVRPIGFSDDNRHFIILRNSKYEYYDLASGNLTQTSKEFYAALELTYHVNHGATAIASSEDKGYLSLYKPDGAKAFSVQAHTSVIRDVFFSENDSLLFTEGDQTIKVWRAANGELLGTLYLFNDGKDYVFVDKDGRFDGNEGGMQQLYYLRNRQVITLDKVYEKFYTPNLFQRLLNGEVFSPVDYILKQAPLVKIQYAEKQRNLSVDDDAPSYQNTTGAAEITVTASSQDDAIDEIRLFRNGKVLNLATRNLIVEDDKSKTSTQKYTVNLLPGNNEIRAIALNTQRTESQPDIINVVYNNGASANTNIIPVVNKKTNAIIDKVDKSATMHLVVVGINAYKNPKMSLNYARADAAAFKEEIEKDAKTVISNIKTWFVTDEAADKTGITTALQQVQQNAKPQDVFVFYYAGHGVIAGGNKEFYLVPNDVADLHNVDEALKTHGIAAKELQQYAINIQAQKQLFILDACQSAGAFTEMLRSDGSQQKNIALVARSTGTHWMAASGAQQFANEFSTLGHGAFTYVLLQALKGEAASDKMITVDGLKNYMQTGVPALMKRYNGTQQTPASFGFGNDFPVEVLK